MAFGSFVTHRLFKMFVHLFSFREADFSQILLFHSEEQEEKLVTLNLHLPNLLFYLCLSCHSYDCQCSEPWLPSIHPCPPIWQPPVNHSVQHARKTQWQNRWTYRKLSFYTPTDPVSLSLFSNTCVSSLFLEPLFDPLGLPALFVSCESASWWRNWHANSEAATGDSWNGRQVHHQHAQRHHPSHTPHPGPAGQER